MASVSESAASRKMSIAEFYTGKTIFLTGGTGFIGKVFIEKLLRSCPDVKHIYCLVRPKKGRAAQERLTALFQQPLYHQLRELQPNFHEKVIAIHGDLLEDELGIRQSDRKLLQDTVDIIFHSAATIRFDEPLKLAVNMNVIGVRKMIQLAKGVKNLVAFVHVSTAYANCDQNSIEEVVYPPPVEPQKLLNALEWMEDDVVEAITPKLIGNKPNTYTYTKHLAESLLLKEGHDLPLLIIRPSIVTAAWKEPVPGWIDNYNGPSGMYVAAGKGLLRSLMCDVRVVADILPVDFPVNLMIAAAWHTVVNRPTEKANIYQLTTGVVNPFTWGDMQTEVAKYFQKNPLDACFRRPKTRVMTESGFLHDLWVLVSHLIPAYAADLGYVLVGQKPRMVRIYRKMHKEMNVLKFFTMRDWTWSHSNVDMLRSHMSSEDQKDFYFDPRAIHWPSYIENYCDGTRKFILKEDLSGVPAARAHIKTLRNIRYTFNTIMLVVFWRLLIAKSSLARNSWNFVLGLVFKFVQFFKLTSTMRS